VSTRVERYLHHLDSITGGVEPRFLPVPGPTGQPRVTMLVYQELFAPGLITAFSYGLSLFEHPEWRQGKPELCITVQGDRTDATLAIGRIADGLGGSCPFSYGNVIRLGHPVEPGSGMSTIVVFAPVYLERSQYLNIDVGEDRPIGIAGCYPIHEAEAEHINTQGLQAFWSGDWDPFDLSRPSSV